jgi:hypothetical protein
MNHLYFVLVCGVVVFASACEWAARGILLSWIHYRQAERCEVSPDACAFAARWSLIATCWIAAVWLAAVLVLLGGL